MGNAPPNTGQHNPLLQILILFLGFLLFFTNGVRAATNQPPKANAASVTTLEDTKLAIKLTGKDPEKQPLTYAIVTQPSHGKVALKGNIATYTPTANYNGKDTFTFTVKDGVVTSQAATVDITVTPVNDAPTCIAPTLPINLAEDTQKTISLSCKDVDGDTLTYNADTPPAAPPAHGTALVYTNIATYTPYANYNGADSFTFKARDGIADSLPVTVELNVKAVNDAPTANNKNSIVITGSPATIVLSGDDVDGDKLTYSVVTSTNKGILGQTSNGSDTLTYTPATGFIGTDSFTFRVNDGKLPSKVATVNISVQTPYVPYVYNPSCILCESAYTKNINNKVFRAKNFSSEKGNQLIEEISAYINSKHLADYGRINWKEVPRETIATWITQISGNNLVAVDGEPAKTLLDIRAKRNDSLNRINTKLDYDLHDAVQFFSHDPYDLLSFILDETDIAFSAAQDAVIITGAFPRKVKIKYHYTKRSLTSVTKKIKKYKDVFGKFKDAPACLKVIDNIVTSQEMESNDVIDGMSACTSWTTAIFEDVKKLSKAKGVIKIADGFQAITASTITNFNGKDDAEIKMVILKEVLDLYDFFLDMASAGGVEVTGPVWAGFDLTAQWLKAYVNGVEMAEKASNETDIEQNKLLIAYTEEVKKIRNSYNVQFMYLMSPAFKVVDLKKDTYITSVTPNIATASSSTLFTVVGANLPETLYATLDSVLCKAQGIQTLVKRQYLCSVPVKNSVEFIVRTNDDLPVVGTPTTIPISKVTNISPLGTGLNKPTTITVSGENLPSTAIFAMADAICDAPTNKTATGFTIVCTPKGTTGTKPIIIKDKPKGSVIDDTRSITVIPTDIDSDHDGMLDYWEWQYGLNVGLNDAASNLDGDDFSNLEEFEAQTKPNDANEQPSIYIISATPGDKQVTLSVDTRGAITYDICYSDEPFVDRLNCTVASGKPATFFNSQSSTQIITGLENDKKYYFVASVEDKKPSNQATATPTKPDLTSGLVAHWSFDDCTAKDVSGNGHDGVINGASCNSGIKSNAFNFNGVNNYISVNDAVDLRLSDKKTSVSFFIKPQVNGIDMLVLRKGFSCWIPGWGVGLSNFSGTSATIVGYSWDGRSFSWLSSNQSDLIAGKWYHIVMNVDGSTAKTYLNGVLVASANVDASVNIDTDSPLFIGAAPEGGCGIPHAFFKGVIDDVRIYNRALSESEIQALYQKDGGNVDNSGWIQNPTTTHYYKALDNCGNWEQCETAAQALGAHLVVIEDQAENDWVASTFKIAATEMGYWIGYTDKEQEGVWKTITGEVAIYTNWLSGEPNNGGNGGRENYAQFMYYGTYGWNDVAGDNYYNWSKYPNTAIIERTAAPNINITANPFTVQAADEVGTAFTVPAGKTQCTFNATGTWKWDVPSAAVTADGIPSADYRFRIPTGNAFDLMLQRTNSNVEHVGASNIINVTGGEVLRFLMNDASGTYGDNSGALSVSWSCQ